MMAVEAPCSAAAGLRIPGRVRRGLGLRGGRVRSRLQYGMATFQSGQPVVDPWARGDWRAAQEAAVRSWHAGYYHTAWGRPVALMVPPTARTQTRWSWGVAQSTMTPLYHQFERPYPSGGLGGFVQPADMPLLPTPRWPSHTDQFGVYYVRGPW
jgi:hypothetical protein